MTGSAWYIEGVLLSLVGLMKADSGKQDLVLIFGLAEARLSWLRQIEDLTKQEIMRSEDAKTD